jgi:predicted TPR repeat methyltransferase
MSDKETLAVYDARAGDYLNLTVTEAPDTQLTRFITELPQGAHVLDLGCGPATASAHMRAAGHHPDPVDASCEMVNLANTTHDINARLARFDEITSIDIYDGIWANFSLLHAPRAEFPTHLSALKTALKPGGLFHIGMKLGTEAERDSIGRFYTYYSEDSLKAHLKDAGFTPFQSDFGSDTGLSGDIAPWITVLSHG